MPAGIVELDHGLQRRAQLVQQIGRTRLQFHGAPVRVAEHLQVALAEPERIAAIGVRRGESGIERDGAVGGGKGLFGLAQLDQDGCQVAPRGGGPRRKRNGALKQPARFLEAALLEQLRAGAEQLPELDGFHA